MDTINYYSCVKSIKLYDPLSDFLGSLDNGIVEITYTEIVKMAGHSCPTVAGAYLMTSKALNALYNGEIPIRGDIKVSFGQNINEGVAGVIANVISNITGATEITGFKGMGGNFVRHSLMSFNDDIGSSARFTRLDTNKTVDVFYNPHIVEGNPEMMPLMQKLLSNTATEYESEEFKNMWQQRVKEIIVDNFDNKALLKVEKVN